jgi:serine/threonine protein kinase
MAFDSLYREAARNGVVPGYGSTHSMAAARVLPAWQRFREEASCAGISQLLGQFIHMTNWQQSHPKRVQVDRYTYEVTDIRKGGFGKVWLLRRPAGARHDTIWGETRAVKTFDADEDSQEAMLEQELGNWVSLDSRYIVPLIKIVRLNFELAAMMEQMPGSLDDYVAKKGVMDEGTVRTVLLDVLRGLDDAYRQAALVHLDLKPANLLLTSDPPHVRISDWGISRRMSRLALDPSRPDAGSWVDDKTQYGAGTLPYMAPERLSGSWTISPAADVFSVGIMGIQLMSGKIPSIDARGAVETIKLIASCSYLSRAEALLAASRSRIGPLFLQMIDPDPAARLRDYPSLIGTVERS